MSLLVLGLAHVYLSLIFPFSLSPLCVVLFAIFLAIQFSYGILADEASDIVSDGLTAVPQNV